MLLMLVVVVVVVIVIVSPRRKRVSLSTSMKKERKTQQADIVGPICESGDYLAKERQLPEFERGELVAVMSAGAYGFTMSSNYNSRPRVTEVLVKGSRSYVIRRREMYSDIVRGEKIPIFLKS